MTFLYALTNFRESSSLQFGPCDVTVCFEALEGSLEGKGVLVGLGIVLWCENEVKFDLLYEKES